MNEESGLVGAVGAMSSLSDYVSTQDHSSAAQGVTSAPAAVAAVANAASRPSAQDVQDALKHINDHLASVDRTLSLHVDPLSGYTVAQISNSQTGQVLQQMPTENHIQLERLLARWAQGGNVLMDEQA